MTENGDHYENAMTEGLNGNLEDELNVGNLPGEMAAIRKQVRSSMDIHNSLRPQMNSNLLTPVQMYALTRSE